MNIIDYFVYLIFRFFHCPPVGKNANDAILTLKQSLAHI